jgi:hypothetical protein
MFMYRTYIRRGKIHRTYREVSFYLFRILHLIQTKHNIDWVERPLEKKDILTLIWNYNSPKTAFCRYLAISMRHRYPNMMPSRESRCSYVDELFQKIKPWILPLMYLISSHNSKLSLTFPRILWPIQWLMLYHIIAMKSPKEGSCHTQRLTTMVVDSLKEWINRLWLSKIS